MARDTIDAVLDILEVSANSFRTVRTMGNLPNTKGVRIISDVVGLMGVLLPAIEEQIRRLRDAKDTGRELTVEEWQALELSVQTSEDKLLALLRSTASTTGV